MYDHVPFLQVALDSSWRTVGPKKSSAYHMSKWSAGMCRAQTVLLDFCRALGQKTGKACRQTHMLGKNASWHVSG